MEYSIDKFDSEIFHNKVAKVYLKNEINEFQLDKLINRLIRNKVKIISLFTPLFSKLINNLQKANFKFIGTQCYLKLNIDINNKDFLDVKNIRSYRKKGIKKLNPFITIINKSSRWSKDIYVKQQLINKYYRQWIINSLRGYVDEIFIKEDNKKIIGFITLKKIDKNRIKIDLVGVLPDFQNKGVGKSLLNKVKVYSLKNNIKEVIVITELENIPALNFYIKNNFKLFNYYLIFHKHI